MARRRSRRRRSSYKREPEAPGPPAELGVEDLSPRARRLVESGVIDLELIVGSGEGGRISSGDILHAARVMEMEQSVARIESVSQPEENSEPAPDPELDQPGEPGIADPEEMGSPAEPIAEPAAGMSDAGATSAAQVGGDPLDVPPDPWNEYNGTTEGLAESALPGAEQSWGEAEANIAAIAEEAAAQVYGRNAQADPDTADAPADGSVPVISDQPEPDAVAVPSDSEQEELPTAAVAPLSEAEAVVDSDVFAEPVGEEDMSVPEAESIDSEAAEQVADEPAVEQREVMMDFGTLEMVDPESVWAEGAEDFAPWFLAHSRQLGDVLGLDSGLSEARQFTTKSATGVVGRDDKGDDVVVVSSQNAEADDSDLGRALGMAASSGAATVALVSAKFHDEQLQALSWLNSQTKSGVQWYAIEMRVVRIADSPAAMLFDLVASPSTG
ncbi:MAG: hypothetical protein GY722_19150 [bacterium]|nr:hypothetical protein [bacterium]